MYFEIIFRIKIPYSPFTTVAFICLFFFFLCEPRQPEDAFEGLEDEEYDALNDETFGSAAVDGDWEEGHEQMATLTEARRISRNQEFTNSLKQQVTKNCSVSAVSFKPIFYWARLCEFFIYFFLIIFYFFFPALKLVSLFSFFFILAECDILCCLLSKYF